MLTPLLDKHGNTDIDYGGGRKKENTSCLLNS